MHYVNTWMTEMPSSLSVGLNEILFKNEYIAGIVDPAAPGVVNISVNELNTEYIDGEVLYVIFDDPEQPTINTALITFGAQSTGGDTFSIGFGEPLDIVPDMVMDFGLGISYGYQEYSDQYSEVDVNGQRLTSCAGGNDDGDYENGALITVGDFFDSNANPPDPYQIADGLADWTYYDDELYDLLPFVDQGDLGIGVFTINPSADDNIFTAHILMTVAAVIGEGVVLTPAQAWRMIGETHTLTATVQDDNGAPVVGRDVAFDVIFGPHMGLWGMDVTDANGQAFFSYTGTAVGLDGIIASFIDSEDNLQFSNIAECMWEDLYNVDVPERMELAQNYPNPFNPTTTISFSLIEPGQVDLAVRNQQGQVVATLVNGTMPVGTHEVEFNAAHLPSGVYFYTLISNDQTFTRKMVLLK